MADDTLNVSSQRLDSEDSGTQYLSFHLDEEEYGIEILLVQEIIRNLKPTKVPNADNTIQGMVNFRGKVIPLIDVRAKLGLPSRELDNFTVSIVLEYQGKNIGLTVDQVSDIVNLSEKNIQLVDEELNHDLKGEHLNGMAKINDRLIMLLDLDKVLAFDELNQLQ